MSSPIDVEWEEATRRFGLAEELHASHLGGAVRVWEGDVTLDTLDLDDGNVVVAGNLTLREDLRSGDESGFLLVTGSLDVRNVLSGGGQIVVRGNVHARHAVHTDYNHGSMWVRGDLAAKVIAAEHLLRVDGALTGITIDFGGFRIAGAFTPEISRQRAVYEAKLTFVPGVYDEQGGVSGVALRARLRDALPILLDGRA